MWLFDDLLKKPTPTTSSQPSSGSSGWFQPPSDDSSVVVPMPKFVIEKSQETVIFWPDTENAKIEAQNVAPKEPTHYEENDSSSVLMATTPVIEGIKDEPVIEQSPKVETIASSFINESSNKAEEEPATETITGLISNNDLESTREESTLINESILAPTQTTDNFFDSLTNTSETSTESSIL